MTAVQTFVRGLIVTFACSAALICAIPSAEAGFDWTPPVKPIPAPSPAATPGPAEAQAPAPDLLTPEPDSAAPLTPVEGAPLKAEDFSAPPAEAAASLPVPGESPAPMPLYSPADVPAPQPAPVNPNIGMKTLTSAQPAPATEPFSAPAPAKVETRPAEIKSAPAPMMSSVPAAPAAEPHQSYPRRKKENAQWDQNKAAARANSQSETVISERPAPAAPVPAPAQPVAVRPAPAPVMTAVAPPAPKPSEDYIPSGIDATPVQGFGKDIPLALALQQVVPSNYAYKFADGVSPAQKVSWNGGKAWPRVLSDMLADSNLQVVIQGNVVTVESIGGFAAPKAPAAPVAAVSAPTKIAKLQEEPAAPAPAAKPVEPPKTTKAAPAKEPNPFKDEPAESADELPVPGQTPAANPAKTTEAKERAAIEAPAAPAETKMAAVTPPAEPPKSERADGPPPVVDITTSRTWQATPGKTLRQTLEEWSKTAGTEIEWMSSYDYPVDHSFVYKGKFDEALDALLSLYANENPRPRGRLYPNLPAGPSVLMIN